MNRARPPRLFALPAVLAVLALGTLPSSAAGPALAIADLRCEYLVNPLGIDEARPRLSWRLVDVRPGGRSQGQTAYRLQVASTPERLRRGQADLWDSGTVRSAETAQVAYSGRPLRSHQACYWRVRAWGRQAAVSAWSGVGSWSMGILRPEDWHAQWVGADLPPAAGRGAPPDPWLRKTLDLAAAPERAVVTVGSLGYHELYVNGRRVGDAVLSPSISDYSKRVRYVTYDVTPLLQPGRNAVGLWLSPGWAAFGAFRQPRTPLVIAQLNAWGRGWSRTAGTDATWRCAASSSRHLGRFNYGGEHVDGAAVRDDWSSPRFDDSAWAPDAVHDAHVALSAEMVEPNRRLTPVKAATLTRQRPGVYRWDMGRSFTGWVEARLRARPGTVVRIHVAERPEQLATYGQTSEFAMGPTGTGVFRNRFNYVAGRWVTIEGLLDDAASAPQLGDVRGTLVRTAYVPAATFACSDPLLQRIRDTVLWTYECLSLGGYTVDCPHRERLGYGGDAHATMETGLKSYHLGAFYTKWLGDWRDLQKPDGDLPYTAPTYEGGGGPAWSGICVSLPWEVYRTYGDRRILERMYPTMRRWMAFLDTKTKDGLLEKWGGVWDFLGDWVPPGKDQGANRVDALSTLFFNNCYRLYNLDTIARVADVLGRPGDARAYRVEADAARAAIHRRFFVASGPSYANGGQLSLALPLLLDIAPAGIRSALAQRLADEIVVRKAGHVDTGIHGTYFLIKTLLKLGRSDLVAMMASQRTYPGWGYMLDQGATTIWEQWDGQNSLLHSSFLSIGSWFIEGVAGIRPDDSAPGYRHFVVEPGMVGGLRWARASLDTVHGRIESDWRRDGPRFTLRVTVPPGTTATIWVPAPAGSVVRESGRPARRSPGVSAAGARAGMQGFVVGSGTYRFTVP